MKNNFEFNKIPDIDIFHKDSKQGLEEYWKLNGQDILLDQIMELDEYVGRIPPSVYAQQFENER